MGWSAAVDVPAYDGLDIEDACGGNCCMLAGQVSRYWPLCTLRSMLAIHQNVGAALLTLCSGVGGCSVRGQWSRCHK
jgi:hypothetical protein